MSAITHILKRPVVKDLAFKMPTFRFLNRVVQNDDGSELVEFAISIFVWISFLFGVSWFSMALYAAHFVSNAAADGARYAMVRGSSWSGTSCSSSTLECAATSDDVKGHIVDSLTPGLSSSHLSVTTIWPGTDTAGNTCDTSDGVNSPNCEVKVTVTYSFEYPLPFAKLQAMLMSSTAQMTIVR